MARRLLTAIVALSLFAALAVLGLSRAGAGVGGTRIAGTRIADTRSPETKATDTADERTRIQTHLARVSEHLRRLPPADLTPDQRAARRVTLQWLDEYRAAGVFPHNHVRSGTRTPVFVDPHGTPCAVGYLLLRSGEDELVEEIVRTDNLVRVPELRGDPRLEDWLDARGITLEEAAMIQPQYGGTPPDIGVQNTSDYVPATVGFSIATAALVSYNALAGSRSGAPLVDGLVVGTTLGHLALLTSDDSGDHQTSTAFNVFGAFVGVGTELVRIMGRGDGGDASRAGLSSHVAPGPNGMEVGFVLRH